MKICEETHNAMAQVEKTVREKLQLDDASSVLGGYETLGEFLDAMSEKIDEKFGSYHDYDTWTRCKQDEWDQLNGLVGYLLTTLEMISFQFKQDGIYTNSDILLAVMEPLLYAVRHGYVYDSEE